MNVLFVCQGNVGRSQFAEAIFNKLAAGAHTATSAGTRVIKEGDDSRVGQTLRDTENSGNVLAVLAEMDIDASHMVRKPLTPEMVAAADKIIVMAESETVPDYLRGSSKAERWEIADPFMQTREFTRDIRDEIRNRVETLLAQLQ